MLKLFIKKNKKKFLINKKSYFILKKINLKIIKIQILNSFKLELI
jgi:hypothetical protein